MKLAPATDIGPRPQNWLRAEDRAKVHRPHPPRWIRQVHPTASSESLCGSGINTIAAVPHPKVPFAQNLFPFWEESSPLTQPPTKSGQVHPTASSESLSGSGINTIAAVPHPEVLFAPNFSPFWEGIQPAHTPPTKSGQVHPTASSESLSGSGINTIAAVPHPKVPFAQNLFPFWKDPVPLAARTREHSTPARSRQSSSPLRSAHSSLSYCLPIRAAAISMAHP
jgi:hypothetical protein